MKVIDLLVRIANGEEVPKKIIGKDSLGKKEEYIYNGFWYIHIFENPDGEEDYYYMDRDIRNLNEEIEIIEEDKKIEKLEEVLKVNRYDLHYHTIDGLHIKRMLEILDKANRER